MQILILKKQFLRKTFLKWRKGNNKTLIEQGRLLEKVKEIAKKEVDPVFEKQIMEDMIKLY